MLVRYRTNAEEMQIIGEAAGTLWEVPVINAILANRLPDHSQDHLSLSDCCAGTVEWELSDVTLAMEIIRRCGGFREYANKVIGGPIL